MMSRLEEDTMVQAMNECLVSELPEPLSESEDRIWCKGIAKVLKCDMSRNYSVVVNDGYGNPTIYHDLGHTASICKIEEVYPAMFLSERYIPVIKTQKDYVNYLCKRGEDTEKVSLMLSSKHADGTPKTDEEKERDRRDVKALAIRHAIDYMLTDITNSEYVCYEDQIKKENGQEEDKE